MKKTLLIFLFFAANIFSQQINVMSYDFKTFAECIEDWNVNDIAEYEGKYTFIHFGHHSYNITVKNSIVSLEETFESLNANERTFLKETAISGNKLTAEIRPWEMFNARFVKLICSIDSSVKSGLTGLLVNEELMYIILGD